MSKLDKNKLSGQAAELLLDEAAEKLARQHQQRLHQMTRAAVYAEKPGTKKSGFALWPVAVPVLSVMAMVLVWQVTQQTELLNQQPVVALKDHLPEDLPAWVSDADVPLAVIENEEFYQWLTAELKNEDHS